MNKSRLLTSFIFVPMALAAAFFAIAPAANAAYGSGHDNDNRGGNSYHGDDGHGGHYTPPPPPPPPPPPHQEPRHDNDNHYQYHPIQTPVYTYPTQTYSYPVYYPVTQPVYYQQPTYYSQPTTYYQPTYYQQPTTYYQPAQTYAYNYQYSAPQYRITGQNNASDNTVSVQGAPTAYVPQEQPDQQPTPSPQASVSDNGSNAAAASLSDAAFGWILALIALILLGFIVYYAVTRRE